MPYHQQFKTMKQESQNTIKTESTANSDYSHDYERNAPKYYRHGGKGNTEDLPSYIEQQMNLEKKAKQQMHSQSPRDYRPSGGSIYPFDSQSVATRSIYPEDASIKRAPAHGKPVRERGLPRSISDRPRRRQENGVGGFGADYKPKSDRSLQVEHDELVPGKYAPDVERRIVERMKRTATELSKKGRYKEAQDNLLQVVQTQEVSLGRTSPELASTRLQLAITMIRLDQLKDALLQLIEANKVFLKFNSSHNNIDLASTLFHIGFVLAKMGHTKEAMQELERAQKIEIKLFGKTHEQTARLLWDLECKSAK